LRECLPLDQAVAGRRDFDLIFRFLDEYDEKIVYSEKSVGR